MKVLVLGYGLLGSEIVKQTNWDFISREKDNIDFTNLESYVKFLENYDTILNCIAYTNTYDSDANKSRDINYMAVTKLSDYCNNLNKKLIHVSTDYIYADSINSASEDDLPLISNNWYTYYKLLADEYIKLKSNNFLICRCSFKKNPFQHERAWINQIGNFDYVDIIASLIIKLIEKNITGVINVGTEIKSIYDLAKQTNKEVLPSIAPLNVPNNVTMNLSKLKKINNIK
jgi:dTDP-4-dehydrorhamnose reductase